MVVASAGSVAEAACVGSVSDERLCFRSTLFFFVDGPPQRDESPGRTLNTEVASDCVRRRACYSFSQVCATQQPLDRRRCRRWIIRRNEHAADSILQDFASSTDIRSDDRQLQRRRFQQNASQRFLPRSMNQQVGREHQIGDVVPVSEAVSHDGRCRTLERLEDLTFKVDALLFP